MKPTSSYLPDGGTIEVPYPLLSLDHEVELAVVVGRKARDVSESTAMDYVGGSSFFTRCCDCVLNASFFFFLCT